MVQNILITLQNTTDEVPLVLQIEEFYQPSC